MDDLKKIFAQGMSFTQDTWDDLKNSDITLYKAAMDALNQGKFIFIHKKIISSHNGKDLSSDSPFGYYRKINGKIIYKPLGMEKIF